MIKINLLPYRAKRKKQIFINHVVIASLSCLPALLGIMISFIIITVKIGNINNEIARTEQEIKKQKVSIEKINAFKAKKEALIQKMEIIKTLQANKSGPVQLMDQLAVNLPGELWLTALKQTGMDAKLEGIAFNNQSISKYMTNLEKSSSFKSVDLEKIVTEEKGSKGLRFKNFTLKCQITYSGK